METLQAEGEGPLIDSVRRATARLARRIEVLDALLEREQARAGKVSEPGSARGLATRLGPSLALGLGGHRGRGRPVAAAYLPGRFTSS
jgi:hypothetical protein